MAEFQALQTATAEWKPHQIAKAGDIASMVKAAGALTKVVNDPLPLAVARLDVVKRLAK